MATATRKESINETVLLSDDDVDRLEREIMSLCHEDYFHPEGDHAQKYDDLISDIMNLCDEGSSSLVGDVGTPADKTVEDGDLTSPNSSKTEYVFEPVTPITPGRFKGVAKVRHHTEVDTKDDDNDDTENLDSIKPVGIPVQGKLIPCESDEGASQDDKVKSKEETTDDLNRTSQDSFLANIDDMVVVDEYFGDSTDQEGSFDASVWETTHKKGMAKTKKNIQTSSKTSKVLVASPPEARREYLLQKRDSMHATSTSKFSCNDEKRADCPLLDLYPDSDDSLMKEMSEDSPKKVNKTSTPRAPAHCRKASTRIMDNGVDAVVNTHSLGKSVASSSCVDERRQESVETGNNIDDGGTSCQTDVKEADYAVIDMDISGILEFNGENIATADNEASSTSGSRSVEVVAASGEKEGTKKPDVFARLGPSLDQLKDKLFGDLTPDDFVNHKPFLFNFMPERSETVSNLIQKFQPRNTRDDVTIEQEPKTAEKEQKVAPRSHLPNLRRMTVLTNEAKSKFIIKKWGSEGIPDPEVNLTCATFLRKRTAKGDSVEIGILEGDHHHASKMSNSSNAGRKRKREETDPDSNLEPHIDKKPKLTAEASGPDSHQDLIQSQIDENTRKQLDENRQYYDEIVERIRRDEQAKRREIDRAFAARFRSMQAKQYNELDRLAHLPYNSITNARYFQLQRCHYEANKQLENKQDNDYDALASKFHNIYRIEREKLIKKNEEVLDSCDMQKAASTLFLPDVKYVEVDVSRQRDRRCRTERAFLPQDIAEAILEEEKLYDSFYAN